MTQAAEQNPSPPALKLTSEGGPETNSLADLLEWFLNYDERTARMRHANTEELFQWKQADDQKNGIAVYPFENAEARFAVGVFQALAQNSTEPELKDWITDVLNALHGSRETKLEIAEANKLDKEPEKFDLAKSEKLTTAAEKRLYLSSCWLEALCTAEARFLGWVYRELYGAPFTP